MSTRPALSASDIPFGGSSRTFTRIGDGHYSLDDSDHAISFDVDRVRRERDALKCELTVFCGLAGASTVDGILSNGYFDLSIPWERDRTAKRLSEAANTSRSQVDWRRLLEELCIRVAAAEREGEPARLLSEYPRPSGDESWEIDGIPLLRRHPVMLFGDGGTAKSYLGLYLAGCLARMGVRVLFADWELAGEDHRERLERLFGSDLPPVHYLRCVRPMVVELDRLRREVEDKGIQYLIADSVAVAASGPPEAAEVASAYFRAVSQLRVGSLHIAHVTKGREDDKEKSAGHKPFGSAFWHNLARATWLVKRAAETADDSRITIGLYNQKANIGPVRRAVGFDVVFEAERTAFRRVDLAGVSELAGSLPLWQRMKHALASGPLTAAALAAELGAPDEDEDARRRRADTIARTARRYKRLFTPVPGHDGAQRWALLTDRAA